MDQRAKIRIGVPEAMLFKRYETEIRAFFRELEKYAAVEVVYSGETAGDILNRGVALCVDEACLPIKVFCGHCSVLAETCDYIVVPRILCDEKGGSFCPKCAGLPEIAASACEGTPMLFTFPIHLDRMRQLLRDLVREGTACGIRKSVIKRALQSACEENRPEESFFRKGNLENPEECVRILVTGHPYLTGDRFLNQNLVQKLERMGAMVEEIPQTEISRMRRSLEMEIMEDIRDYDRLCRRKKEKVASGAETWIKRPYWSFLKDQCAVAKDVERCASYWDGVVLISSSGCGTDSITSELNAGRNSIPVLTIKLDEHTGEAGMDTRLEAFYEMLERRKYYECNDPSFRRNASVCGTVVS